MSGGAKNFFIDLKLSVLLTAFLVEAASKSGTTEVAGPEALSADGSVTEIVERRDAVRLRPDADRAGARNVIVRLLDVGLAVEQHLDSLAGELDAQRVPAVGRHGCVNILDRMAPAAGGVIERHVVFQRVGAGDVVVVAILPAPYDPSRLVLPALFGLEFHFDETVGQRGALLDAPGKRPGAALPEHVGRARRRAVCVDGPLGIAPSRYAARPAGRRGARLVLVEIVRFPECRGGGKHRQCSHDESSHFLLPLSGRRRDSRCALRRPRQAPSAARNWRSRSWFPRFDEFQGFMP